MKQIKVNNEPQQQVSESRKFNGGRGLASIDIFIRYRQNIIGYVDLKMQKNY